MSLTTPLTPQTGDALIVVDVQNDFLPGGSLAVATGDDVIAPLNRYIRAFLSKGLPIVATRDWHTADHCSFEAQGGIWPAHCIAGSRGARFAPALQLPERALVVSKADSSDKDAYSGFEDTGLAERLTSLGVKRVFVGGLATDYCVLNTVLDALRHGFEVVLLCDAIRAVDVRPGDGDAAIGRMIEAGARELTFDRLGV